MKRKSSKKDPNLPQHIYVLRNKATEKVFYVGCTQNVKQREGYYRREKTLEVFQDSHAVCKYLLVSQVNFDLEVIHTCQFEEWEFWEQFYIASFRKEGPLCNAHIGGTDHRGENNPAYGKPGYWKNKEGNFKNVKRPKEFSDNLKEKQIGEGNPSFGTTFKGRVAEKARRVEIVMKLRKQGLAPKAICEQLNWPVSTVFNYIRTGEKQ